MKSVTVVSLLNPSCSLSGNRSCSQQGASSENQVKLQHADTTTGFQKFQCFDTTNIISKCNFRGKQIFPAQHPVPKMLKTKSSNRRLRIESGGLEPRYCSSHNPVNKTA